VPSRPKHQNKDLEKILKWAERAGWTFTKGRKYFMGKCHCGKHMKTVRLTPSGARYGENLKHWFVRLECWKGEALR
jgi:hypothetical protein